MKLVQLTLWIMLLAACRPVDAQKVLQLPAKDPSTKQTATGGFWRTDRSFDAVLRIKNILLKSPLQVAPVVYMADGTEVALRPIVLEPAGAVSINIRNAIIDSGVALGPHLSDFGMAEVRYRWGWSAVAATVQNIDELESVTLHSSLTANIQRLSDTSQVAGPQTIKGMWWMPHAAPGGFVSIERRIDHKYL